MQTPTGAKNCSSAGLSTLGILEPFAPTQLGVSLNGGTPVAGWFVRNNPIKMDDLGVALCQETPNSCELTQGENQNCLPISVSRI